MSYLSIIQQEIVFKPEVFGVWIPLAFGLTIGLIYIIISWVKSGSIEEGRVSLIGLIAYALTYLVIILIISPIYLDLAVYSSFAILFGSLIINLLSYRHRDAPDEVNPPKTKGILVEPQKANPKIPDDYRQLPIDEIRSDSPAVILSLMYGFVAAFAITEALRTFSDALTISSEKILNLPLERILNLPLEKIIEMGRTASPSFFYIPFHNLSDLINLIGFFSIAIPFIHAGLVFLTTRAAEIMTLDRRKGQARNLFIIFLFSFIQAMFLYFIAINIDNTRQFILWLTLALLVDLVWSGLSMRINLSQAVIQLTSRKKLTNYVSYIEDDKIPIEWIHVNILTTGFFISLMILNPSILEDAFISFLLVCVLFLRTISDYITGWRAIYVRRLID
jgi:hypothetical protein